MTKFSLVVPAVVLLCALAGCAPSEVPAPTGSPSASAAPSTEATPSASPTLAPSAAPAPQSRPSLDQLVLSPTGFAELSLGSSPAALDPAMSIVEYVDLNCGTETVLMGWEPVEQDPSVAFGSFGVLVNAEGALSAIQVHSPQIQTEKGIGVGSSRADVLSAYPGISVLASDHRFDVYVIEAGASWMRMSVVNYAEENGFPAVQKDTVYEMTASMGGKESYLPSFHPLGASCL